MEITTRSLWTLIHGMGFGALYLLAGSGAIVALYRRSFNRTFAAESPQAEIASSASISASWPHWPGSPFSPEPTSSIRGIAPRLPPDTLNPQSLSALAVCFPIPQPASGT